MKFTALNSNLNLRALREQLRIPLEALLNVCWWVLLGVLLALLCLDGFLFYRYGFEAAGPPPRAERKEALRLNEDLIRRAAAMLEERRQRFEAKPGVTADLPNPFR